MIRQRAGRPVRVGEFVVIPLERMSIVAARGGDGIRGYVSLSPAGVAVLSSRGIDILNELGERVPAEDYLENTEGLQEAASCLTPALNASLPATSASPREPRPEGRNS